MGRYQKKEFPHPAFHPMVTTSTGSRFPMGHEAIPGHACSVAGGGINRSVQALCRRSTASATAVRNPSSVSSAALIASVPASSPKITRRSAWLIWVW